MASETISGASSGVARIAITFDLEMCRNFPTWDGTDHWDYQKAEVDEATKAYALAAARRVRDRGGRVHCFVLGRTLEQECVDWLLELREQGHRLSNHTYDHINLLAESGEDLQFRFRRAPWLVKGRRLMDIIEENIRLTSAAMETRLGIKSTGFRAPYSFEAGLEERADLQELMRRCGFNWVSTKYPRHSISLERCSEACLSEIIGALENARPFRYPNQVIEIPMSPISDIFAFRNGRWSLEQFRYAISRAMTATIEHAGVFDFLAHPACLLAMDPEFTVVELICDRVDEAEKRARIVDLDEIASHIAGRAGERSAEPPIPAAMGPSTPSMTT